MSNNVHVYEPYALTSQFCRGVRGAEDAAQDATGRFWSRGPALADQDDEDFPVWPKCLACGREVDMLDEPHWYQPDENLYLHDAPACVTVTYPEATP